MSPCKMAYQPQTGHYFLQERGFAGAESFKSQSQNKSEKSQLQQNRHDIKFYIFTQVSWKTTFLMIKHFHSLWSR